MSTLFACVVLCLFLLSECSDDPVSSGNDLRSVQSEPMPNKHRVTTPDEAIKEQKLDRVLEDVTKLKKMTDPYVQEERW